MILWLCSKSTGCGEAVINVSAKMYCSRGDVAETGVTVASPPTCDSRLHALMKRRRSLRCCSFVGFAVVGVSCVACSVAYVATVVTMRALAA